MIERVGRFTITGKIGEGGMGVVYAAHDPRLDRPVAIKMVREEAAGERERQRLWREARAAAKVSHPNICQLYEIGEEDGTLFIAMELLEGEPLADRIARGPIPFDEAVKITNLILSALETLHAQGFVHRDLKPTNVFLTPVGVKILDFGLARPITGLGGDGADMAVTQAGILMGTPRYMAPEVWREQEIGPPADLFSVGALLYEMLAGRPAFPGDALLQVHEAIMTREPPMLGGSAAAAAVDQVIHRALRKHASERYQTAAAMAAALRDALSMEDSAERVAPLRLMRFIALPFRVLRPDPDTDFLAFSLPDAVTSSLSGLGSLVVRSTATAARFSQDELRLDDIASRTGVDIVLSGTLLRFGEQLRVTAQLLEAPAGTVLWSQTFQTDIRDLFEIQDTLTKRIVESLAVPLGARDRAALRREAPASAQAYEFYLRANQLAYDAQKWELARDLYRQCLDLDPGYAPAWARLGRLYRVISIYDDRAHDEYSMMAQEAFRRAIQINPDLSIAHNLYTFIEVEMGRAQDALQRLLDRARANMNDAELFAGLVQACRYCGLLDAAIAAWERARRLDPTIRTAVAHAFLLRGDYDRAIEADIDDPPFVTPMALELSGRVDEALAIVRKVEETSVPRLMHDMVTSLRALLEGRIDEAKPPAERLLAGWRSKDPCGRYFLMRLAARLGFTEQALPLFRAVVEDGFYCYEFMSRDPWLDPVRGEPGFEGILQRVEERQREAQRVFSSCGGERILGL